MGKRNLKKIPSDQIDEQIDVYLQRHHPDAQDPPTFRAIRQLERYYSPRSDAALPLERVRQRLKQHVAAQSVTQLPSHSDGIAGPKHGTFIRKEGPFIPAAIEVRSQAVQERNARMKEITPGPKKMGKVARFFGTLAAVLVITLLVGSLIWVIGASRGNTHVASPSASSTPTAEEPDAPGIYILDDLDANANKYAVLKLDVHTHAVVWSYPVPLDGSLGDPISVHGDTVYVALALGNDTYLYALNALDGSLRWKIAMNQYTVPGQSGSDAAQAGSIMQPTAAHGMVYVLARGESLVALDATTGKHLWTYTSRAKKALDCTNAEIMDGLVYGTCHNVIFALNARTGAFIWSQSAPSHQIFNSPVAIDGKVYLTSSQEDQHYAGEAVSGGAYAYNGTNGQLLWQHPIDNWVGDAPTVVNGVVYFGCNDHSIYGLRASDGVQVWRYDAGGVVGGVEVSNGVAYAEQQGIQQGDTTSGTPSFLAVQISNSQQLWVKKGTWGTASALGDVLYISGADGFTALDGRTSTVIWHGTEAVLGIDIVP